MGAFARENDGKVISSGDSLNLETWIQLGYRAWSFYIRYNPLFTQLEIRTTP